MQGNTPPLTGAPRVTGAGTGQPQPQSCWDKFCAFCRTLWACLCCCTCLRSRTTTITTPTTSVSTPTGEATPRTTGRGTRHSTTTPTASESTPTGEARPRTTGRRTRPTQQDQALSAQSRNLRYITNNRCVRERIPDARFKEILINSNALTADTGKTDNVITLAIAFGMDLADCVYLLEQIANDGPQGLQRNASGTAQSLRGVINDSARNNVVVQPDRERSPMLHEWMEISQWDCYDNEPSFFLNAVSEIMGLRSTGHPLPRDIRYYIGDTHVPTPDEEPDEELTSPRPTEAQTRRRRPRRHRRRLERESRAPFPVQEEPMPLAEGVTSPVTHRIHPGAVRGLRNEMLIFGNGGGTELEFRLGSITERPDLLERERLNIVCPAAPSNRPPYGTGGTFNSLLNADHPSWNPEFNRAVQREIQGRQLGALVQISVPCAGAGTNQETRAYIAMNPLTSSHIGNTEASRDHAERELRRHYERILTQLNQSGINACQISLAMGSNLGPTRSIRALYDAIRELQHTDEGIPNLQRIVIADPNPQVAHAFDRQAQAHEIAPTIHDERTAVEIAAMRERHERRADEPQIPTTRSGSAAPRTTGDPARALNTGDEHLSAHNDTLNLVITDNMFDYTRRLNTPNLGVNAANGNLSHGGGIAAEFVNRAGRTLQRDSDRLIRRLGRAVATGAFTATDAYHLNDPTDPNYQQTEAILHAVGPIYSGPGGEATNLQILEDLYYSLIMESDNTYNGIDLIMPLLSVGIFRVPVRLSVQALYQAVERARRNLGDNCPRVHAVLSNRFDPDQRRNEAKTAFNQCLAGNITQPSATTARAATPTGEPRRTRRRRAVAEPVESWRAQFPYIARFVDNGRMVVRPVKELVTEGKIDETTICPTMRDTFFTIPRSRLRPGQSLNDLDENERNTLLDEILVGDDEKYAIEVTSTLHPVREELEFWGQIHEATVGAAPAQGDDGQDIPCRHISSMNGMEGVLRNATTRFENPDYAPGYGGYTVEGNAAWCRAVCPVCRVRLTDGEAEFRGLPGFDG